MFSFTLKNSTSQLEDAVFYTGFIWKKKYCILNRPFYNEETVLY